MTSELENGNINRIIKKDDEHPRVPKVPSKKLLNSSETENPDIISQNKINELKGSVVKLTEQKDSL